MGNPRENKEEKKGEEKTDYLQPMKDQIASIIKVGETKGARDGFLNTLNTSLSPIAVSTLDNVKAAAGTLGSDNLTKLTTLEAKDPLARSDEEKKLDDKWTASQATLLASAAGKLDVMTRGVETEVKKLFDSPPAFDKTEWDKVFQKSIDDFKRDIRAERTTLLQEKKTILDGPPPPSDETKEEINARSKQQLDALTNLEKHYIAQVGNQRDVEIFKAMSEAKFHDPAVPVGPGAPAGGAIGDFLNPGKELSLKEHAQQLHLTDLLSQVKRITKEKLLWDDYEAAEFEKKGFIPGKYHTNITLDKHGNVAGAALAAKGGALSHAGIVFDITSSGGIHIGNVFGRWGRSESRTENCKLLLELFSAMSYGKPEGKLTIEKDTSIKVVQAFADAVLARKEAGQDHPTLKLDDASIKILLEQRILRTRKIDTFSNTPEEIAKVCVQLQGQKADNSPEYQAAYQTQLARVQGLAAGIQEDYRAKEEKKRDAGDEKKNEAAGGKAPVAKGRPAGP